MLIFSVNEAIGLIKSIGLIMIAEARLGKCSALVLHQLCSQHKLLATGCIVDTRLTAVTVLDDKQKNLLLEPLQLQRFKLQLFDIITLTNRY